MTTSPNQSPEPIQSSTESATNVVGPFYLAMNESGDNAYVKTKCNPCKDSTLHYMLMATPTHNENGPDLEQTRRLLTCTVCGNLSLKK